MVVNFQELPCANIFKSVADLISGKTNRNGLSENIEDMKIQNKTLHWRHSANGGNWIGAKTETDFVILTDKWTS